MNFPFSTPIPPYPDWQRRIYWLSRPVRKDDIWAFLGTEDPYIRDTDTGLVYIIHKYGLLEIHALIGKKCIEVWHSPESGAYPLAYLDALLATRF
jgi:hypothetical protein